MTPPLKGPQPCPVLARLPELMDREAELTALRWAASHVMDSHDRAALRLAEGNPNELLPTECTCSICRQVRPFVDRKTTAYPGVH